MKTTHFQILIGAIFTISLACRPVLTIGWQEIGILVLIVLILAGPALFKLYKRFDEFQKWKDDRGKKKKKK